MTPNLIAYAALIVWPIVSLVLFATRRTGHALIWTFLGAHLLLPAGSAAAIKFPGVPGLDKQTIPALAALLGCWIFARSPAVKSRVGLAELLLLALLVGPFITSEFNGDNVFIGQGIVLPGVGHYDALSASVSQLLILLPFLLGRRFLRNSQDNLDILRFLTMAGLVYTLPMLLEVRLSPQLHTWIYGYFPHSFGQQMRDGGFRPVVFLGHGLQVAFFGMTAVVASAALWKTSMQVWRLPPAAVTAWLGGVLLLCKSLGSLLYAAVLVPIIFWVKPLAQVRLAVVLVTIALAYPMLRTADLIPVNFLVETASSVSAERSQSLQIRFEQEKTLLVHATERIWFGWGRFGRGRVYDEYGKDITLADGHWIITIGTFGVFGFLAEFGLIALTVFRTAGAMRYTTSARDRVYLATLALIVAIGMIDLIPNSTISPWSWLVAGALLGRTESLYNARNRRIVPNAVLAGSGARISPQRIEGGLPPVSGR